MVHRRVLTTVLLCGIGAVGRASPQGGGGARPVANAERVNPPKLGITPATVAIASATGSRADEILTEVTRTLSGAGATVILPHAVSPLLDRYRIDRSKLDGSSLGALKDSLPQGIVMTLDVTRAHIEQQHGAERPSLCDLLPRRTPCIPERYANTDADITVLVSVFEPATGRSWLKQRVTASSSSSAVGRDGSYPAYPDSVPVFREAVTRVAQSIARLVRPWKVP